MHSSTQQFVRAMDAKDIKHSDPEAAAGGRETVTVIYSGENIPSIRMRFFFDQDCQDVAIRVFDLVKVPEAKLDVLLKAINAVNRRFRFAKFVLDTDDNSRPGRAGRRIPQPRRGGDLPGADGPLRGHLRQSVSRSDEGPLGLSRAPSILGIESGGSMCYTGLTFSGGKLYDTQ